MSVVSENITLDLTRRGVPIQVLVKQYDTDTRHFIVKITNNGQSWKPTDGAVPFLEVTRPDGEADAFELSFSGDDVLCVIPGWATQVDGEGFADIAFVDPDGSTISTMPFELVVVESGANLDAMEQTEAYSLLVSLIKEVESVKNGDVENIGCKNSVSGYKNTVQLSEGNQAEKRLFDELVKAGIIPDGATEYVGGIVTGNESVHGGSGITAGNFNINHGRGNYTNGKNAKAIGYEQFVDSQDGTAIGTMNIIRAFKAGLVFGIANIMTPDQNRDTPTDTEPTNGYINGCFNEMYADSGWIGGIYNRIFHENVYQLGRKITSQNKDQFLLGFNPAVTAQTLFAVGDGTDDAPHNLIVAYKNMTTRRATHMWFNTRVMTEGNVESDKKVIAKQAPTQDNDCIRWQEYKELLSKIKALESKIDGGFTLTFANVLLNTEFTLSVDGGTAISGENCVGKSFVGTEFVFTALDTEVGVFYNTESNPEEVWLNGNWLNPGESATLTLTENATITKTWCH